MSFNMKVDMKLMALCLLITPLCNDALGVASDISSTVLLNDGVEMPLFGLGTARDGGLLTENAVVFALQHGYRLIDTAQLYENEEEVGNGIHRSGVKRKEIFIVSKVWDENHGYDATIASVKESLQKLQTGYIDLYLIHSPYNGRNIDTYAALQHLKQNYSMIRSVGVSNFGVHHMEGLREAGLPPPSINQIELHPFQRKEDTVKYCIEHNITVMGYSPLVLGLKHDDQDIFNMAYRYNKTAAQILLRWSIQNGYVTIPKSTKPQRIVENSNIFDFSLSHEDLAMLNSKPAFSCAWDPTIIAWNG